MVTYVVRKGAEMPRHGDNIRKRSDGRWEGRYRYRNTEGIYKYKSIYGKTYHEVKERMSSALLCRAKCEKEALEIEYRQTTEYHNSNKSFCEISEKWLEHVKKCRKYSTYIKYLSLYEHHIKERLQDAFVSDVTSDFINEKIFDMECSNNISPNLRHSVLAVINQILKYAHEYCQCPIIKLPNKFPKDRNNHIEIINHSDQALLLKYLYQDIDASKVGIILCISTGLRLGEICSLKWDDVDMEQMIIHVNSTVQRIAQLSQETKTSLMVTSPKSIFSIREIPISEELTRLLHLVKSNDSEYMLGVQKPMEPRTYQNRFKRYLRDIGLKEYNFHALRHTFATNCIDNGMDVKSLSEILGHSDVQITLNRYVHPTMNTKRKYITVLSSVYSQYCGQP